MCFGVLLCLCVSVGQFGCVSVCVSVCVHLCVYVSVCVSVCAFACFLYVLPVHVCINLCVIKIHSIHDHSSMQQFPSLTLSIAMHTR